MKFEARSAAVFRDFEKMYKLVALYQGNRDQLSPHVRNLDASLQATLGDSDFSEGMIQFDLLMQAVYAEGLEIYKANRPELTMSYALFCEGVRSVVASRGLSGEEILEWCLMLREALRPKQGESVDLASILWRNRFQHLRVHIFNSLLNIEEIGLEATDDSEMNEELNPFATEDWKIDKTLAQEELSRKTKKFSLGGGVLGGDRVSQERAAIGLKALRDEFWALPSAQKFIHSALPMDATEVHRLKGNLADAAYSDRARNLVRFSTEEVRAIRGELEAYDSNHIEFNLLVTLFETFKIWDQVPAKAKDLILRQVDQVARSILRRFHAGLMLFLLKNLAPLRNRPEFKSFLETVAEGMKKSLEKLDNRRLLLDSLESETGQKTGFEILKLLKQEDWNSILDTCIAERRKQSAGGFLEFLFQNSSDIEKVLLGLGPQRLSFLIPALEARKWEGLDRFLIKCVQSSSPEVVEACLGALPQMKIPVDQAMLIFKKLSDRFRAEWLDKIIASKNDELWAPFAQYLARSSEWRRLGDNAALAVIRLILVFAKDAGFQSLLPFVQGRSWRFWPEFPHERELILSALCLLRNPRLNSETEELLSKEVKILFQSRTLKDRMKERLGW